MLRFSLITGVCTALLLAGCAANQAIDNPVLETQRATELADMLAALIISNDPVAQEPDTRASIEREITRAKRALAEAQARQNECVQGGLLPIKVNVQGWTALCKDRLHFGSDFWSTPGADLRVLVTAMVDPRDGDFPDQTAIDLGQLEYPYGPMSFTVGNTKDLEILRTVVLWDKKFNRLYGFAQLSKR